MRRSLPPRWRAPAVLIVAGAVALVIGGATHGWHTVPEILPIPLAVGVFLYFMAGRDTDYGAFLRRQVDERQELQGLRIQAFIGRVLGIGVAVAYGVALFTKATIWPWAVLMVLMAGSFVAGRFIYGEHDELSSRPRPSR